MPMLIMRSSNTRRLVGETLKDPAALGDELLINDNGVLKKITLQQISSLVVIPPGTVNDFAGTTEPTGWLFCYGQLVSRTYLYGAFSGHRSDIFSR